MATLTGAARAPWWAPPLLAVQFLTRVPVPGVRDLSGAQVREGLGRSVVWFPVVGGLVGLATSAVLVGSHRVWPAVVAALVALAFEARLTGAFHEDAVADFCDAFGGGLTRERTLEIMKDSRIGSYGALGLLVAVGLRAALLVTLLLALSWGQVVAAAVAAAAAGRWAAVVLSTTVPPVPASQGLAKDIAVRLGPRQAVVGTLLALPFAAPWAVTEPTRGAAALVGAAVVLLWLRRLVLRRLGGVTGDCLGTAVMAVQLVVLGAAAAMR